MDDIIEKIEKRQDELLNKLGQTKAEHDDYKYIVENAKILHDMKITAIREDNARLNNNEVNDINRMKVEVENRKVDVEQQRLKVEKMKIGAGLADSLIDAGKAGAFCWIAYNGDKVSYAIKSIYQVASGYLKSKKKI